MDKGDWNEVADVARHLLKRDFSADPAKLQMSIPPKPDFMRNLWLTKLNKLFPYLVVAVSKLLSAHVMPFAAERNRSAWCSIYMRLRNSLGLEAAEWYFFLKANLPGEYS